MDRIEETQTYLNMLQGKLINEKKIISQHQEIQRIPMSYPYISFTQWDMILRKQIICYIKYINIYLIYYSSNKIFSFRFSRRKKMEAGICINLCQRC